MNVHPRRVGPYIPAPAWRGCTFEPEVTVKVSRIPGLRIYEVPITYAGRTYAEGKKIGAQDAARAFFVLARHAVWPRR